MSETRKLKKKQENNYKIFQILQTTVVHHNSCLMVTNQYKDGISST